MKIIEAISYCFGLLPTGVKVAFILFFIAYAFIFTFLASLPFVFLARDVKEYNEYLEDIEDEELTE